MNNSVALIMQDCTISNSFIEGTHIFIYTKHDDKWSITKKVPIKIDFSLGMIVLREQVRNLAIELGECNIIAGKELQGIPYSVFDRMGFHIFDITEFNEETLNAILFDILTGDELERMRKETIEKAKPVETSTPGIYFLDLIALQEKFPEVSSKKALQNFFKEIPFLELELVCSHLPPWINEFGYEIAPRPYQENKVKATIRNKFCNK